MEKDKRRLGDAQARNLGSIVAVLLTVVLAAVLISAYTRVRAEGRGGGGEGEGDPCERTHRPPYQLEDFEDLIEYVTSPTAHCRQWLQINGTSKEEDPKQVSGLEGTFLCLDGFQHTPDKCRIYSFDPNLSDLQFELKMGRDGCRVHIVTASTDYNYAKVDENTYIYPLDLATSTSPGNYTLDNLLNLLGHERKTIQYVKTTRRGSEWLFLQTLFASAVEAFRHIKQIRLLIHLPAAETENDLDFFKEKYRLLMGLEYYGYRVTFSRPIPGTEYYQEDLRSHMATKYEVIWIKP